MSQEERPLRKILFEADNESVWAFELGDNLYRIDNIPFFTALVSYGDVVVAEQLEDAAPGFMRHVRVHSRGGHSTFRVRLNPEQQESTEFLLTFFKDNGCGTERTRDGEVAVVAIDVPPLTVDQSDMFWKMLAGAADEKFWTYSVGYTESKPPWERE